MSTESRNIFGWLGMKQEEALLKDAKTHVDVTYQTVVNFKNAISAYIEGDSAAKVKFIAEVRKNEKEADGIRSKMIDMLSESPLLPHDREDLMHFIKTLDRIADWTNGSARLLGFLDKPLPEKLMDNITIATQIIFDSISKLKDAIGALLNNEAKQAIKDCHEVDELESKADDQKNTLIGIIVNSDLPAGKLMVVYHLAEYLEGITDKIEDAADSIKVMAIKVK
ncbi:MAG: DUF47 family protein [Candidatus Omnitrophica bacterium]|nr:DUF47 family protein [Candidatus Omnitrophota bacterium]